MVKRAAKSPASRAGKAPKARKRSPVSPAATKLKRELAEALERQKATSDILNAINNSNMELQPILDTIVRTASRLCDAQFALIYKLVDGKYHLAATNRTTTGFIKYASEHPLSPGRGSLVGRVALEQQVVHLTDCRILNTRHLSISGPANTAPPWAFHCSKRERLSASLP